MLSQLTSQTVPLVGPEVPPYFHTDGCSGGAPDKWFGILVSRGCLVHDYEYHLGRISDQVLYGQWAKNGDSFIRRQNGLKQKIKRAKADLGNLRRGQYPAVQVQRKKLELYTYRTAFRRFKRKVKDDRILADRQLGENIRRMGEAGYMSGEIKAWQRASLWAIAGRYIGATKRWGGRAVHGPGFPENFEDLKERTELRFAALELEWENSHA